MMNMLDIKMVVCIIIATLFLVFPDTILTTFPMIKNLFNDSVNYVLLIILVILTLLIDLHCGIIFALSVIFISMYIDNQHKSSIVIRKNDNMIINAMATNALTTNALTTNPIINKINNNNERKVKFNEEPKFIATTDDTIRSDSEFIYDTTNPFPNKNIKPFQYNTENSKSTIVTNSANHNLNGVQENVQEIIDNKGEPERSGYDINGCRYDMKNSPQNLTNYGPPLAHCQTYNLDKFKTCGTLFYPLNA